MISCCACFVMLELFLHCCLHKVEFSGIVPWVPVFFLSFLIFYSLWRGLFATKSATNSILLGIAILSGNFSLTGTVIPLLQTGNS